MKKLIFVLIISLWACSSQSQETQKVSFLDIVKTMVSDPNSVFYYPKLLEKVKSHPGDLTQTDVQYLYYGQIFKIGYDPRHPFDDDRTTFDRYIANGRKKKVIELGTELLQKYPVDLTALMYTSKYMKDKKIADTSYFWGNRFDLLLKSILGSGDGKSYQTAFIVTSIWDEFIIKGVLGYFGGQDALGGAKDNYGSYCVWNTPQGKIYFEEIYPAPEKE